jgi:hypothetical protein
LVDKIYGLFLTSYLLMRKVRRLKSAKQVNYKFTNVSFLIFFSFFR